MVNTQLNVISSSESERLKSLLKNPDEDFQEIISLLKKKVEKTTNRLKKSEERYRSMIKYTSDAVFCYEYNPPIPVNLPIEEQVKLLYSSVLVECNIVCAQSYGYERVEDVIGRKLTELFGTTSDSLDKLFISMIKGGYHIVDGVGIEKLPNGEERYFLNNGHGIIEKGKLLRIWGTFRDVTDRIKAEKKLKDSEEKFKMLFNNANDTITIIDLDGKIIECNQTLSDRLGYTKEELLHKSPRDFISSEYAASFTGRISELRQKGEAFYESAYVRKDTSVVPIELNSKLINFEGKPAILSIARDITERKKAEENLRESDEKFSKAFHSSPNMMAITRMEDGYIIDVNNSFTQTLGYKREELIGHSTVEMDLWVNSEEQSEFLKLLKKDKKVNVLDVDVRTKSGEIITSLFSGDIIYLNNEPHLITMASDITERRNTQSKLKESEERFRTLTEQSLMGIGIVQDNKFKYLNKAYADIFEFTVEEMMSWGKKEAVKCIHPDDMDFALEQLAKKQEGVSDYVINYQYRGITKSGRTIWIDQFSKSIMFNRKPADFITLIDITEKKRAEEELIKLTKLKSELMRRTSHELKTPLVSIKGFSELLLELHKDKFEDYVVNTIEEIRQGCIRLEYLIGDILKAAELESDSVRLKKSEEDLSFLIRLCVNELKGFSTLRNHKVKLDLHDELITIFEKEQIHQVLSNLLTNAFKFTPINGKIEIKSKIRNDFIEISIKDNGMGFTEEEKKILFKQFGKIERYGQGLEVIPDGSGLGLYISKKIIELHGGQIWVESEGRNRGSTFFFSLPIIKS